MNFAKWKRALPLIGLQYSVSAATQDYMIEQKIDTTLAILYIAGFQLAVFGVEKISNNLPQTVTTTYANQDKD